jgi:tripartite motif-containing protein 71
VNTGTGGSGVAVDAEGNVWVVDHVNKRVQELSSTGAYLAQFGSAGKGNGQLENPVAIDILPSGALPVTDRTNGNVQEFSPEGVYVIQFGSGQLSEPEGIAVASSGSIYVASSSGHAVKKWINP